eukprot:scaffold77000_cov45-Prasinocladus_malaysianus.AAC.3
MGCRGRPFNGFPLLLRQFLPGTALRLCTGATPLRVVAVASLALKESRSRLPPVWWAWPSACPFTGPAAALGPASLAAGVLDGSEAEMRHAAGSGALGIHLAAAGGLLITLVRTAFAFGLRIKSGLGHDAVCGTAAGEVTAGLTANAEDLRLFLLWPAAPGTPRSSGRDSYKHCLARNRHYHISPRSTSIHTLNDTGTLPALLTAWFKTAKTCQLETDNRYHTDNR